jgi:zinc transport system substrate-binding protein
MIMSFKSFIRKYAVFIVWAVILMLVLIQLLSCSSHKILSPETASNNSGSTNVIKIVTSIIPAEEFIEKIGADRVEVTVMVPQGTNPHTYEPSPGQLKALSGAIMYAKMGSGLEFELAWLDNLVAVNPDIYMLDLSEGVTPIFGYEAHENHKDDYSSEAEVSSQRSMTGSNSSDNQIENEREGSFKKGADPHIWLSPQNVKIIAGNICRALSVLDSGGREFYNKNLDIFVTGLNELDLKIRNGLSDKKNKKFIVYHPAWAYFAEDYGLVQVAVEQQGKEPTAREIASVIALAKENGIKVIFASPQFNPKSAEVIAGEIGGTVVFIDPLGPDYMQNMEIVLESMKKYLQ